VREIKLAKFKMGSSVNKYTDTAANAACRTVADGPVVFSSLRRGHLWTVVALRTSFAAEAVFKLTRRLVVPCGLVLLPDIDARLLVAPKDLDKIRLEARMLSPVHVAHRALSETLSPHKLGLGARVHARCPAVHRYGPFSKLS